MPPPAFGRRRHRVLRGFALLGRRWRRASRPLAHTRSAERGNRNAEREVAEGAEGVRQHRAQRSPKDTDDDRMRAAARPKKLNKHHTICLPLDYLDDFRVFYNKTIYPELSRMERLRRRLLRNFLIAVFATSVLIFVGFFTGIPVVGWLSVVLSVMLWVSYGGRVYSYASVFKPNVIRLIIDFIDNRVNFSDLQYEEKRLIPKEQFNASYIFPTGYDEYYGEDYIWGKIGELPFEMCELFVQRISPVRARMDVVFRGIFLKATFSQDMGRGILVIPRDQKPQLGAAIQRFAAMGGRNVDNTIDNPDFGKVFTILATPDSSYVGVLSHEMETAIYEYQKATGKHVYLSFIGKEMFVAVTQDRDMMEPPYLRNNISYDLIREFYDDLVLLMGIVLDFDTNN